MKRVLVLLILSISSSMILTAGSLLHKQTVEMQDFVVDRYGFPYWWFEHVYVTFEGKTHYSHIEMSNLAKDIVLYLLVSLGIWFIILLSKQRRTQSTKMKTTIVESISKF